MAGAAAKQAVHPVRGPPTEPGLGPFDMAIVRRLVAFGAFVEIMPGTDGLIHISELDAKRVNKVTDVINEGDELMVKVRALERLGLRPGD